MKLRKTHALVLVAALAAIAGIGSGSANAAGGGAFVGEASLGKFGDNGNPRTDSSFTGQISGHLNGQTLLNVLIGAQGFTYTELGDASSPSCVLTGTADGVVVLDTDGDGRTHSANYPSTTGSPDSGDTKYNFSWRRVGATAVVVLSNTDGSAAGAAVAGFAAHTTGNPCGQPVTADVAGAVAETNL